MPDWQTIDFFSDQTLVEDPYPYFDQLRSECPVLTLPHLGVVAVTGALRQRVHRPACWSGPRGP